MGQTQYSPPFIQGGGGLLNPNALPSYVLCLKLSVLYSDELLCCSPIQRYLDCAEKNKEPATQP